MKNKDISIHDIVPKHIRRATYKKAIEAIESEKRIAGLCSFGLCLILPCLLWDLDHFLSQTPQNRAWDAYDTPSMFPELTEKRIHSISRIYSDNPQIDRNKQRIKVLTEMLAELETL